jgi:uncharacterized protein YjdB
MISVDAGKIDDFGGSGSGRHYLDVAVQGITWMYLDVAVQGITWMYLDVAVQGITWMYLDVPGKVHVTAETNHACRMGM